jgi:hypothetical protein
MTNAGKDSAEVVKFMQCFAKLKDWTDDDANGLVELASEDDPLRELCNDVFWAAAILEMNERRRRETFTTPVDPIFIRCWRDYEERYQSALARIALDLGQEFDKDQPSEFTRANFLWNEADVEAKAQATGISEAIEFAQDNADQDHRWDEDQEDFIYRIKEGVAAWEGLKERTGFNMQGVFRRRALIPFVLVPRKIGAKHGNAETVLMLKNLQQAHDAFVFGTPHAAIALLRSVAESVLRGHYGAGEGDFIELIKSARSRLPSGANEAALHRLRKLANSVLHLNNKSFERFPNSEESRQEKEIVSLLFVIRTLIEDAP